MNHYDAIIFINIPAFYKINLFNALEDRGLRLLLVFLRPREPLRDKDYLVINEIKSSYVIMDTRRKYAFLCKLLRENSSPMVLVGGWDEVEYWIINKCLAFSRQKGLLLESSIHESRVSGLRAVLKRFFLTGIEFVLSAGEEHGDLLGALSFKGSVFTLNGVGLINTPVIAPRPKREFEKRFLFIGRFIWEKNLGTLIRIFNKNPEWKLTLIGDGPCKDEMTAAITSPNITLADYVENSSIMNCYLDHDVFILPSISETWGIVIDEAIYFGLPVIVSDKVGCKRHFIDNNGLGLAFSGEDDLEATIQKMCEKYDVFKKRVEDFSIIKTNEVLVDTMVTVINNER